MIRDLNQADYEELARVWRSSSSSTQAHQRLMASASFPNQLRTDNMRGGEPLEFWATSLVVTFVVALAAPDGSVI